MDKCKCGSPLHSGNIEKCDLCERLEVPELKTLEITDFVGGFLKAVPNCDGCGQPLKIENAWMADGCSCNSHLGVNNMNETRWRLLMELQQRQAMALEQAAIDLEKIVCVKEPDCGVIFLSNDSPSHYDAEVGGHVYDHKHFSPLGDALIALHEHLTLWRQP